MARTEIAVTHKNHDSHGKVRSKQQPTQSEPRGNLLVCIVCCAALMLALAVAVVAVSTLHPLVMPVMRILVTSLMMGMCCLAGYFIVVAVQYGNYTRTHAQDTTDDANRNQEPVLSGKEFLDMMAPHSPLALVVSAAEFCAFIQLASMCDTLGVEADGMRVALTVITVVAFRAGFKHLMPLLPEAMDGDAANSRKNQTTTS